MSGRFETKVNRTNKGIRCAASCGEVIKPNTIYVHNVIDLPGSNRTARLNLCPKCGRTIIEKDIMNLRNVLVGLKINTGGIE